MQEMAGQQSSLWPTRKATCWRAFLLFHRSTKHGFRAAREVCNLRLWIQNPFTMYERFFKIVISDQENLLGEARLAE